MATQYGAAGSYFPVVGRILLGLVFFLTGVFKLMGAEAVTAYIASVGLPMPEVTFWISTVLEVIAGAALILGFHARSAAWVLFVYTALTIAFFHNNFSDQMQLTAALKNLAIMGGLLYVAKFGPGRWGLWTRNGCWCCDDGNCVCGMGERKVM